MICDWPLRCHAKPNGHNIAKHPLGSDYEAAGVLTCL
eukprot:CAMPEP_0179907040 /NCGR_PEP_ID=MMETSP0982-20121206/43617_1 /TAXON_ID=483367 /ORGANISM="non described non described, Strain CCMP 2436" /LENGTH=36 /DNA_ID= /DNA_START= /DNA_END= /DNA_ORIENTATION=